MTDPLHMELCRKCLLKPLNASGLGEGLWGETREPVRAGEGRGKGGGMAAGGLDQGF